MRECPGCKAPLANGAVCCNSCGWSSTTSKGDPESWRCAYDDLGQRCPNVGVISRSIHGGRFYCRAHDPRSDYAETTKSIPPMGFGNLRAKLRPIAQDAERQLERIAIQNEKQ